MVRLLLMSILPLLILTQATLGQTKHPKQKVSSPLRLEITLPKDTVSVSDSIALMGKVTNVSKESVRFYAIFEMPVTVALRIRERTTGRMIDSDVRIHPGRLRKEDVCILAPGASLEFTVPDIRYDYEVNVPGTYTITGLYRMWAELPEEKELHVWEGTLFSKPIMLRVR